MTAYQHPFRIVSQPSSFHPSFHIVTRIPPAPMRVECAAHLTDDFGTLFPVDHLALAIHLNADNCRDTLH